MILAIIPARGGSKRIPKKNIKKLGGKPLIKYTIDAANKSELLDDIVVSTDNQEIHDLVKCYGTMALERPKTLSQDWSKTIDVILHVIRRIECDMVVCLQPTSPFRTGQDIDNAIRLFQAKKCESVISVCEAGHNQAWMMKWNNQYLTPIFGHKYFRSTDKTMPKIYVPNGAIYVATPRTLYKYKSFYTKYTLPYVMPKDRSLDIDDMDDWVIAEATIHHENYSQPKS